MLNDCEQPEVPVAKGGIATETIVETRGSRMIWSRRHKELTGKKRWYQICTLTMKQMLENVGRANKNEEDRQPKWRLGGHNFVSQG